ncbi:MAG: ABC transporter ATP-binding protein [Solirubrobacterales bacterium]|nr:ABC transporter ATP-binding protein [Solirubrobacterales bacterium]
MSVTTEAPTVEIRNVGKTFKRSGHSFEVLKDVTLAVGLDEILTVLGPSGCGKSTLLNCIAGLETYDGLITVNQREVRTPSTEVAVVFQAPELLPWRTVRGNARYGLELSKAAPKSEWNQRIDAALEVVGLSDSADLYPRQLSGGMQQRVNIARALAVRPRVLLMDEPFGALDAITKERMQEELQRIVASERLTVVFITHDISEAIYLGNRVAVMSKNPGGVRLIQEIAEPRPRELSYKRSPGFQELYTQLWSSL